MIMYLLFCHKIEMSFYFSTEYLTFHPLKAHGLWREKTWSEEEDTLQHQQSHTLDGKLF